MSAWFAGDFERCLDLCNAVRARDVETRAHVGLLRARALLRLRRIDDALEALQVVPVAAPESDAAVTMLMLTAEAHVRRGEPQVGLTILRELTPVASHAHHTIRSEVTLNIGLALYSLGDFAAADSALRKVEHDTDMVYARSLQYRGWVANARSEPARATRFFTQALTALDTCKHYDRFFDANCTRALAHLAVETFDRDTWAFTSARRARIDWSSAALAEPQFFIAYCAAAYQLDVAANALDAARESRFCEEIAPSPAFRVQARCRRAAIAGAVCEELAQRDHAESAADLFAELDSSTFAGDEKTVPLVLAEQLAPFDADRARRLLDLHRTLSPAPPMYIVSRSAAAEGYGILVEALVREASGDPTGAAPLYRRSLETFRKAGYTRRAALTALRLWSITRDPALLQFARNATSELSPNSWIRRELDRASAQRINLTAVQREVIALICQGKSNPEIARLRKRSLHTVRNLVARLFELFEVQSREQLAVECVRRGLYSPS